LGIDGNFHTGEDKLKTPVPQFKGYFRYGSGMEVFRNTPNIGSLEAKAPYMVSKQVDRQKVPASNLGPGID